MLGVAALSAAQQPGNPTTQSGVTPPRGVYVIANARIVTVSGPEIENGSIVIRDGKITAVGTSVSVPVPSGAVTINARGLSVYPGMIDAGTAMGLVEVGQGAAGTVDTAEVGDLNPNAKAIIAVNPHSAHIGVTRVDGVTSAVSLPSGGLISGQGALINLLGTSPAEMAVVPYAALVINYPRTSAGGGAFGGAQQETDLTTALAAANRQVEQIRKMLREGKLDDREIEIEVAAVSGNMEIFGPPGMEELTQQIQGMFHNMGNARKKTAELRVEETAAAVQIQGIALQRPIPGCRRHAPIAKLTCAERSGLRRR